MNKLILTAILLLHTITGYSEFNKAILYLENGEKKTGFSEMVDPDDAKVLFKADENSKKEVIPSSDIKKIEYTDKAGNSYLAERLYMMSLTLSGKYSKSKEKKWFYVVYSEEVKIGATSYAGNLKYNPIHGTTTGQSGETSYFFGAGKSDELYFGYLKSHGAAIHTTTGQTIRKMSKVVFANCPELIEKIEKEDFKTKTALDQLIAIFEKVECL